MCSTLRPVTAGALSPHSTVAPGHEAGARGMGRSLSCPRTQGPWLWASASSSVSRAVDNGTLRFSRSVFQTLSWGKPVLGCWRRALRAQGSVTALPLSHPHSTLTGLRAAPAPSTPHPAGTETGGSHRLTDRDGVRAANRDCRAGVPRNVLLGLQRPPVFPSQPTVSHTHSPPTAADPRTPAPSAQTVPHINTHTPALTHMGAGGRTEGSPVPSAVTQSCHNLPLQQPLPQNEQGHRELIAEAKPRPPSSSDLSDRPRGAGPWERCSWAASQHDGLPRGGRGAPRFHTEREGQSPPRKLSASPFDLAVFSNFYTMDVDYLREKMKHYF